jgi:restriction system protein
MANITQKRLGEMVRAIFKILGDHADGMRAKDALGLLEKEVPPTPYEMGHFEKSGLKRFEKIARFATIAAVKAGWMNKSKGIWMLTEEGRSALRNFQDPEAFQREAVRLYNEWKNQEPSSEEETGTDETKVAAITFELAEEQAWVEIEEHLKSVNPYALQDMASALLKAMGYHVTWVAPPGKDGGVDVIAHTDPLGTKSPRIKVQVKRLDKTVSVDGVRAFMSLLGNDDVGLFINTGGFTRDAEDLARSQETRKVTLVNLEKFFDLWVENYAKLDELGKRLFPLQPIYFLAPKA